MDTRKPTYQDFMDYGVVDFEFGYWVFKSETSRANDNTGCDW